MAYVEKPMSAFDQLFLDMSRKASLASLVRNFGPLPAMLDGPAGERLRSELSWLQVPRGGVPIRTVAHCFCAF